MTTLAELRPHQVRALQMLREAIAKGARRPLLQLPTGAGKTVIAAHIVHGARAKRNRVGFVVPAISLIDQTLERFRDNGLSMGDMGVMQADHPWRRIAAPIQIISAQTLGRRGRPGVDVVLVDEAHVRHQPVLDWIDEAKDLLFIGLSATPWARGLGEHYDALIKPTSIAELIDEGYLSPMRVFAPSHPDLTGVRTVAGDYHERELEDRMSAAPLVADVVQTWIERGRGRPTLCFAVGRNHAKALAERFAAAAVRTAYVDADTPREERSRIGEALARGEVEVVVNIGTLTTGIDWDVRCLIMARPTKSEMLFVQIIGRALRPAPGKDYALILDHSDNHARLGLATDIDHAKLHDGTATGDKQQSATKEERQAKAPLTCKECSAILPAGSPHCLVCGTVLPPKKDTPKEAEGELAEVVTLQPKQSPERISVRARLQAMGRESIYGQLRVMATRRVARDGWVGWKYKEIFGEWPAGKVLSAPPEQPTLELQNWLRSREIAFHRARRAGGGRG